MIYLKVEKAVKNKKYIPQNIKDQGKVEGHAWTRGWRTNHSS